LLTIEIPEHSVSGRQREKLISHLDFETTHPTVVAGFADPASHERPQGRLTLIANLRVVGAQQDLCERFGVEPVVRQQPPTEDVFFGALASKE
jgi:hypothetical protein